MFNKIGITGDIHGDLTITRIKRANREGYDCLIVAGDFGYLWDNSLEEKEALNEIEKLPMTILFVSGNHENYDLLNEYPISNWNGGKVQFIRKNIIHLLRGQVFNINNKNFFTFGGARSVDTYMREKNLNWWEEEMPTEEEMNEGISVLEEYNNKVDYVITHTCYSELLPEIVRFPEEDSLTKYLSFIKKNIEYNHWYFGHMHIDYHINDKDSCLYKLIIEIK